MAYFTENFSYIWSKFKYNFVAQPCRVTINNIIKELPSIVPIESTISALNKAYMITTLKFSIGPATHIDFNDIEHDNTHKGAFVQNFVSGTKNGWLWYFNVPRGTKTHGFDRVASDIVLKGGCKVGSKFISIFKDQTLLTNIICEDLGFTFLDGMERIENNNQSYVNLTVWKHNVANMDNAIAASRKAIISPVISKLATDYMIKPSEKNLYAKIPHVLEYMLGATIATGIVFYSAAKIHIKDIPLLGAVASTHLYSSIANFVIWPGFTTIAKLIPAGILIVPLVRIGIYEINNKVKVFVEQDNQLKIQETGEILALAKEQNINIEYKYDAHKAKELKPEYKFAFEVKKSFYHLSEAELLADSTNRIIIHYPVEEDWVGAVEQATASIVGHSVNGFEGLLDYTAGALNLLEDTIYETFVFLEDSITHWWIGE